MKNSFRNRLLRWAMLLFSCISIMTNILTYSVNKATTLQLVIDKNLLALNSFCNNISKEMIDMRSHVGMLLINPIIIDYIKNSYYEETLGIPYAEKATVITEIQRYYYGMQIYNPTLASISIIIAEQKLDHYAIRSGEHSDSLNRILGSKWYQTAVSQDEAYFVGCHDSYFVKGSKTLDNVDIIEDKRYFSIAKSILNMTSKEAYGVVLCCYEANDLIDTLSVSLSDEVYSFRVVDKNTGNVLLSNLPDENEWALPDHLQRLTDGEEAIQINDGNIALASQVQGTDFIVIAELLNIESMYSIPNRLLMLSTLITIVGISIFFIVMAVYSHQVTRPVKAILTTIQAMEQGNLSERVNEGQMMDEFVSIGRQINFMGESMEHLIQETKQKEREKNEASFLALQMQINPHFMCNTLNCIRLMALLKDQNEISDMLEATTHVLSNAFKNNDSFTSLREAVELIHSFEAIMRMRYGETFHIEYRVEDKALSCKVLKFMIQPCVENAILHGILPKSEPGTILLSASIHENRLVVEITDDGVGTSLDLAHLNEQERKGKYTSIGLNNVFSRLRLIYGEAASIETWSAPGKGTTIRFFLPMERLEEERT